MWSINVTATDKQYSVTYAKVRFRSIFTIHYTIQPYNHYFVLTVLSIKVVYQFEFSTSKLVRFINVLFFTSLHDVDKVCYHKKTNTYSSSCNIPAIYVLSIPIWAKFLFNLLTVSYTRVIEYYQNWFHFWFMSVCLVCIVLF